MVMMRMPLPFQISILKFSGTEQFHDNNVSNYWESVLSIEKLDFFNCNEAHTLIF